MYKVRMTFQIILLLSLLLSHSSFVSASTTTCLTNSLRALKVLPDRTKGVSKFGYGEMVTLSNPAGVKSITKKGDKIRIVEYNMLNLEASVGKHVRDLKSDKLKKVSSVVLKDPKKRVHQANIIKKLNPDIAILTEVEGVAPLYRFAEGEKYLNNGYYPLVVRGNDTRGIDIAFLIKKDLKIRVDLHSFKNFKKGSTNKNVFSRDFPVLEIREVGADKSSPPLLVVAGTHLKSRRSRKNDPFSNNLRELQVEASIKIQKLLDAHYKSKIPMVIGGDFNTNADALNYAKELIPYKKVGYKDAFELTKNHDVGKAGVRATHTYHPKEGPTQANQIDSFHLNSSLQEKVTVNQAGIYRYKDASGNEIPLPKTYDERSLNPSDHFPIWVDLTIE